MSVDRVPCVSVLWGRERSCSDLCARDGTLEEGFFFTIT